MLGFQIMLFTHIPCEFFFIDGGADFFQHFDIGLCLIKFQNSMQQVSVFEVIQHFLIQIKMLKTNGWLSSFKLSPYFGEVFAQLFFIAGRLIKDVIVDLIGQTLAGKKLGVGHPANDLVESPCQNAIHSATSKQRTIYCFWCCFRYSAKL